MSSYRTAMITWAVGLALGCAGPGLRAQATDERPVQRLRVAVAETAGIRRFGYPVSTVLQLPEPVGDTAHFRLLDGNRPVRAQFGPLGDTAGRARAVSLDFAVDHAPLETREYVV